MTLIKQARKVEQRLRTQYLKNDAEQIDAADTIASLIAELEAAQMATAEKLALREGISIATRREIYSGFFHVAKLSADTNATLITELEADQKDAARYRWLRDEAFNSFVADHMTVYPRNTLDQAIDAAIAAGRTK